jgi:hypothetical protein
MSNSPPKSPPVQQPQPVSTIPNYENLSFEQRRLAQDQAAAAARAAKPKG